VEQRAINPWAWQDNFGFSQAIEFKKHERVLLCSGQTSVDENGMAVHAGDIGAQIGKALDNLETVLGKAGMTLGNVVQMNIYTTNVEAIMPALGVWSERLGAAGCKPACTLLGVAALFEPEIMVELEATAVA
jgi:enamine deaminase RidA (YjgF/YER057c/UK114 family)